VSLTEQVPILPEVESRLEEILMLRWHYQSWQQVVRSGRILEYFGQEYWVEEVEMLYLQLQR
jgi:hypothetical protein